MNKKHKLRMIFFLVFLLILIPPAYADYFRCESHLPIALQVETISGCNQESSIESPKIIKEYNTNPMQFNADLMISALTHNNFGGALINFSKNNQKEVYRSAILTAAPECLRSLVKERGVQTLVNLYAGDLGNNSLLANLEQNTFYLVGGQNYIRILNYSVLNNKIFNQNQFNLRVASIIKIIKHAPGNVVMHCLTGEHDTGVIFGVLQKCYNKLPLSEILAETECHIGSSTHFARWSYQIVALRIKNFPCELLKEKNLLHTPPLQGRLLQK